jgi:hypothetical protein
MTDGEARDRIGGEPVTTRFDRLTESARAFDAQDNGLAAMTGFWFAWYAFHPETDPTRAITRPGHWVV